MDLNLVHTSPYKISANPDFVGLNCDPLKTIAILSYPHF